MSVSTVSTYTIVQTTLNDVNKVEADLNTEQQQLSSGKQSSDFTGIASQTQQFLSLDNILAKTQQYLDDNKIVENRVSATNTVLTHIISSATTLQNLISQRLSGTSNTAAFQVQLKGSWQDITNQLNTTVGDQYIFSGTKTNVQPVDSKNFPTLKIIGTPDNSYYHGSEQDIVATAQDNTQITYNVRADAPGFQKIYAAMAMAKLGDANGNTIQLTQAENLLQSGLQDIISTQATVGAVASQYSSIDTSLSNQKLYWKGIQETIGNADLVSISSQVATNQGILQAAFQTFAKITSLRLADFLK